MEAFPAVLKKVPTAKLIVAGANHHTKPGYWESIRDSHNLEARGSNSAAMFPRKLFPIFTARPAWW